MYFRVSCLQRDHDSNPILCVWQLHSGFTRDLITKGLRQKHLSLRSTEFEAGFTRDLITKGLRPFNSCLTKISPSYLDLLVT